jgi:hypothetical protein
VERVATCVCGQLAIRCRGEPELVSSCHCLACQRRTGSAFGITAFYRRVNIVETTGQFATFVRKSEAGRSITNRFCPMCGSTVYWEPEFWPDHIGVAVGGFGDPSFERPARAVWTEKRHHWVVLPQDMPQHPQGP